MINTSYSGEDLYLWTFPPDWSRGLEGEFALPGHAQEGLSAQEQRWRLAELIRVTKLRYSAVLGDTEPAQLRRTLRALTTERVAMPFWLAAKHPDDYATADIQGSLHITFDLDEAGWPDFAEFEIHATVAPPTHPITEDTRTAPLLLGYLDDGLASRLENDRLTEVGVDWQEDSDADEALVIATQNFADGPSIGAMTPKVFPARPDYSEPPRAGTTRIILDRTKSGQGRRTGRDYHGALPAETFAMRFDLGDEQEIVDLLRFFLDRGGLVESFWLPAEISAAVLQADIPDGAKTFEVDSTDDLSVGDTLALCNGDRDVFTATITGIDGTTVTLDAAPGGGSVVIQIAFLVDITGSMEDIIDEVTSALGTMASELSAVAVAQFALVTFKDENAVTTVQDFTDSATIIAALNALTASGGGDDDEAGYAAVDQAIDDLSWSAAAAARHIVLATDEQSHERGATEEDALAALASEAVVFNYYAPADKSTYQGLTAATGGRRIVDENDLTGAYTATLVSLLSAILTFRRGDTLITHLRLVRLTRRRIALAWEHHALADVDLEFREVRPEAEAAAADLGAQTTIGHLYELTDGTTTWRYTSFERDLTLSGDTFTASQFSHGAITRGLSFDDEASIEDDVSVSHPLWQWHRGQIAQPEITIRRVNVSGGVASSPAILFKGVVGRATLRGNKIRAKCSMLGRDYDTLLPKLRFQRVCNWALFSAPCGLDIADWTFSAEVVSVDTDWPYQVTVDTITRDNESAMPYLWADWFAWGRVTIGGETANVTSSTEEDSGEVTLTLDRVLASEPAVGADVELVPGCDGRIGTCDNKFLTTNLPGTVVSYTTNTAAVWAQTLFYYMFQQRNIRQYHAVDPPTVDDKRGELVVTLDQPYADGAFEGLLVRIGVREWLIDESLADSGNDHKLIFFENLPAGPDVGETVSIREGNRVNFGGHQVSTTNIMIFDEPSLRA